MMLASLVPHIGEPLPTPSINPGKIPLPEQKHTIAVLPFENLSNDPEQSYFCEGLAEDLLDRLSRSRDLIVKARSSSFRFRHQEHTVVSVAHLLDATHVLRGSVRKSGSRIRVNVQLLDANDARVLWSDRYDRQLSNFFALQDEITNAIFVALDAEPSAQLVGPLGFPRSEQ